MIILLVLILLTAVPTILKLARNRQWAELMTYSILIVFSLGISIASVLDMEIPPIFTILGELTVKTYERLKAAFV